MAFKYKDLRYVLEENEIIFDAITNHSLGGPVPFIIGMTPEAKEMLATNRGREVSKEFEQAMRKHIQHLIRANSWEHRDGKKRPYDALLSDVTFTSGMIAGYIGNLQWLAEKRP